MRFASTATFGPTVHHYPINMAAAKFFTILAGIIGVLALAIYLFGIPPELKRKLERQALKTMGENKMSYVAKGMLITLTA